MYVVFAEEIENPADAQSRLVPGLEQAFASIIDRCGLSHAFEAAEGGWKLVLRDVERPEVSPEPIFSTCIKPRDAKHDLFSQAVDGRLKGHVAIHYDQFKRLQRLSA